MSRKSKHATCNCHYHYIMPVEMAPMDLVYGTSQMPDMTNMYGSEYLMPDMSNMYGCGYQMPDYMDGSYMAGNPHNPDGAFAGAFAGGPFFPPFFFPFFFSRRFFPFFSPFFFPFF